MTTPNWTDDVGDDVFEEEFIEEYPPGVEIENQTQSASNCWEAWVEQRQAETDELRRKSWSRMRSKINGVLRYMKDEEIDLPLFLDAFTWGHDECRDDGLISQARAHLIFSKELPGILERLYLPPKSSPNTARPRGAKESGAFVDLTIRCVADRIWDEMEEAAAFLRTTSKKVSLAELQLTTYEDIIEDMKTKMPVLWQVIDFSVRGPKGTSGKNDDVQRERTYMTAISVLAYTRRQSYNRLQKLFAIYFKFHGLSARAFDTLHSLGLAMSMKWTTESVADLAASAKRSMLSLRDKSLWFMTHDNLNLAFQVYSQRINNQTHFDSGTAGTIYFKTNEEVLIDEELTKLLQEKRAEGLSNPISTRELLMLDMKATENLEPFLVHEILKVVLESPEFDIKTYAHREDPLLQEPPAILQLPHGPDYVALQYLLATVKMEEASYEGNNLLLREWMQQLELYTPEERKKTGKSRVIMFAGDQLTADRVRMLTRFRAEDYNSFDRYDFLVPLSGWLHTSMAHANSLHEQYLGTPAGRGLHHAMILLKRRGLLRSLTKGPFFHDIKELLIQVLQSLLRLSWKLSISNDDLSTLREKTPEQLKSLARSVYRKFASTAGMLEVYKEDDKYDEIKHQTIRMTRDILHFVVLQNAIHRGDVGIIRNMLPHLFFRFHGGSNPKYAVEMLELIQSLEKEWPDEIKNLVLQHGWLLNFRGKSDSFLPLDMAQEHNVRDIKDTYRPEGPNSDWEYLKKISPAIPTIKAVGAHVEQESGVVSRGKKHGVPDSMEDILLLERSFRDSFVLEDKNNRELPDTEFKPDVLNDGYVDIQKGKFLKKWHLGRNYKRSKDEIWEVPTDVIIYEMNLDEDESPSQNVADTTETTEAQEAQHVIDNTELIST